jgi:hypothetical protein
MLRARFSVAEALKAPAASANDVVKVPRVRTARATINGRVPSGSGSPGVSGFAGAYMVGCHTGSLDTLVTSMLIVASAGFWTTLRFLREVSRFLIAATAFCLSTVAASTSPDGSVLVDT